MEGYDKAAALAHVLRRIAESGRFPPAADADVRRIVETAQGEDWRYIESLGDGYYDDDDAYERIVDNTVEALGDEVADELLVAEAVDAYLEYHEEYMDRIGLLSWE